MINILALFHNRIRVYKAGEMIIDSDCQCNTATTGPITGGKLGLYVFSQPGVIFSDMRYKCLDDSNEIEFCDAR